MNQNEIPRASPTDHGFQIDVLKKLGDQVEDWVRSGLVPGISLMVLHRDHVVYEQVRGILDIETNAPLRKDSLFRIYSMTKPIVAFAALQLVERGLITLDDPIARVLPEWNDLEVYNGGSGEQALPMSLRHLLSHTSGLSYGIYGDTYVDRKYRELGIVDDWDYVCKDAREMVELLTRIPLMFQPGTRWHYSLASDVVGHVIERVSDQPLDQCLQSNIFDALGIHDAYFDVPKIALSRFGTDQFFVENGKFRLQDSPREDPEFIGVTFLSGGGGLVMTIEDFAKVALTMANRGLYAETQLLGTNFTASMYENQVAPSSNQGESMRYTCGLGINNRPQFAHLDRVNTAIYFWGGAAGTLFWIDPEYELVVVIMVQLLNGTNSMHDFVMKTVYESLTE